MKSFGGGWSPNSPQRRLSVINLLRLCNTWLPRFKKVIVIDAHCELNSGNFLWCVALSVSQIVSTAEKDKELFESKFSSSAEVIDSLKENLQDLSSRLGASEENIKRRKFLVCFSHILLIWEKLLV